MTRVHQAARPWPLGTWELPVLMVETAALTQQGSSRSAVFVTLGVSSPCFCSPYGQVPRLWGSYGTARKTVMRGGQVTLFRQEVLLGLGTVHFIPGGCTWSGCGAGA